MKKMFVLVAAAICFIGCAPTHTLKEVVHDPNLLFPALAINKDTDPSLGSNAAAATATDDDDNPIMAADRWIRKNLW